jgi:hypothetical protein
VGEIGVVLEEKCATEKKGGVMHILNGDTGTLADWIRREVEFEREISQGQRGPAVKRVQEWLTAHQCGVAVDGDFGAVTKRAVQKFQGQVGLEPSGVVDRETFERLVQPMRRVLSLSVPRTAGSLEQVVVATAQAHLAQHPIEVGGQNRGPWVRLYMEGRDGPEWAWCAGFVTFIVRQAVELLNARMPIAGSFSCDSLASQARNEGLFVPEREASRDTMRPGAIFLVRRTSTDWTHTGFVADFAAGAFDTIEGNTNDDGHREGFEVCARSRAFKDKDFIRLSRS